MPSSTRCGSPSRTLRSMKAPGVALVGVADDVLARALGLADRAPLEAGGVAGAAAPAQAADAVISLDHLGGRHLGDGLLQRLVGAGGDARLDPLGVDAAGVLEDDLRSASRRRPRSPSARRSVAGVPPTACSATMRAAVVGVHLLVEAGLALGLAPGRAARRRRGPGSRCRRPRPRRQRPPPSPSSSRAWRTAWPPFERHPAAAHTATRQRLPSTRSRSVSCISRRASVLMAAPLRRARSRRSTARRARASPRSRSCPPPRRRRRRPARGRRRRCSAR